MYRGVLVIHQVTVDAEARELLGKLVHVPGELLEGFGRLVLALEARDKVRSVARGR